MLLPILLTSILLLIQSGPTNLLNNAPVAQMSDDSNECLTFTNVSHDYNYSQPSQYSFNISADMVNNCSDDIMYPSTLIENDTVGIETSSDDSNWRYIIGGNSSYHVEWEVTRSQDIPDGTFVTFDLHPTRDNCHVNCTESQNYSFRMVIAIGPIDISTCYGIGDIHHDYDANLSQNSFNLTAELNNSCPGGIHYPQGILWNDTAGVASSPPGGVGNYGMSAYMIFSNTSTNATWQITLDSNITNGTYVTFTIEPVCWMYTLDPMYMQDCEYTPLNSKELVIHIGSQEPVNQTNNTSDSDGDSIPDSDDDCPNTPAGTAVDSHGCPEESIYIWPDDVGGYAGRAHNYSLTFNASMNSMITLYEVDHLAANTTYLIEWYISNGSTSAYVAYGNLTTDSVNNTGYSTPLHSALNLSDGCYAVWAELHDDTGQMRDDDEFTLCITTAAATDSDGDGVPDSDDDCPNTPAGTAVDSHGCPEEIPVESPDCTNTSTGSIHRDTAVIFFISWTDSSGNEHCGTLHIDLHDGAAPIHSENFRQHVQDGNYNGSIFHRIIDGFMIQGGDFEYGLGYGGYAASWQGYCNGQAMASESDCSSSNLYTIPDEANNGFNHGPGVISMAKTSMPNTGGSQFFFVDQNSHTSHLDGVHTVFGVALNGSIDGVNSTGLAVINAISEVVTGVQDKPTYDVTIVKAILYDSPSEPCCWDPENDDENSFADELEDEDASESGFVPGFGITLGICALMGAALSRRKL